MTTDRRPSNIVQMHPRDELWVLETVFNLAVNSETAGNIDAARKLYKRILARAAYGPALLNLGTLEFNRRHFVAARACYQVATEVDPSPIAFFNLANVLDEFRLWERARKAYLCALDLDPSYADAHYNLAIVLELLGHRREAMRHYRVYIHSRPRDSWSSIARQAVHRLLLSDPLQVVTQTENLCSLLPQKRQPPKHSLQLNLFTSTSE